MFSIEYSRDAAKALRSMPRNVAQTIVGKIKYLAADPYAPNNNVRRLRGSNDTAFASANGASSTAGTTTVSWSRCSRSAPEEVHTNDHPIP